MTQNLTCAHATAANPYQVQCLGIKDIPDAMALIAAIKSSNCLLKPHHLKERPAEYFAQMIEDGYALLGIKNEFGQLIAFTTISPTLGDETSLTIRAQSTHPDYRGQGLGEKLVLGALNWAETNGHAMVKARIATDNTPSLELFGKAGFKVESRLWDKDEAYWYHILSHSAVTASAPKAYTASDPFSLLPAYN